MITRGFKSRRQRGDPARVPPGQYVTNDFPVLSAGPTPRTQLETWSFAFRDVDGRELATWRWEELRALPSTNVTVDIHCVTKWSKLDTQWKGITIDALLEAAGLDDPPAPFVTAFCDGGYTTNLALDDLLDVRGVVAYEYDGGPIDPEHGGPARLLVPHLYFWKSAKWVRGLQFMEENEPGFWETHGYHLRGDPWKEERYAGD
jgi:DMSO/TMAO reductase YedYZ molybdopterin-dependent catalytic subunit